MHVYILRKPESQITGGGFFLGGEGGGADSHGLGLKCIPPTPSTNCPIFWACPICPEFAVYAVYVQQFHQINRLTPKEITKSHGYHWLAGPEIPGL